MTLRTNVVISILELRHIIECGFLPLSCTCAVNPDGSLLIKVFEPSSGRVDLLVTAVTTGNLTSSRAISNLIAELRAEMAMRQSLSRESCSGGGGLSHSNLL
jgi:hypothetical protein